MILLLLLFLLTPANSSPPTTKHQNLQLTDITHTIKTTSRYNGKRLETILLTWFPLVANHTWVITDAPSIPIDVKTNGRLISTPCLNKHWARPLTCKMNVEYDTYMTRGDTAWWCHWDDDNYVNMDALLTLLRKYDSTKPWYIGRPSHKINIKYKGENTTLVFAHGGCGFCLSRALAHKMAPYARNGKMTALLDELVPSVNDDCVVGFIVGKILKVALTVTVLMHSHNRMHATKMKSLTSAQLNHQVSLSYSFPMDVCLDLSDIERTFSKKDDPTRFYSVHCFLYPEKASLLCKDVWRQLH